MVVFVLLMQFLWKYIDDLVGKGLDTDVIIELLLYTSASLVPMALPLAVLLASIMTFGNLAEYNELLALKSAGIPLSRIMAPIMALSLLITISAFLFNNHVLPFSNLKMRSLLFDIQRQNPELQIKAGIFDNTLEGYSIRIENKDPKTNLLKNIRIYDHTDRQGNTTVTVADSGYMKMTQDERFLLFTLYNGITYTEMQKKKKRSQLNTYPARRDKFEMEEMVVEMVDFGLKRTDEDLFKSSYQMMTLNQLNQIEDSLIDEITGAQRSLIRTLELSSYFKKKNSLKKRGITHDPASIKNDSISQDSAKITKEKRIITLNIDSIYNSLGNEEKSSTLKQTIGLSRSAINYINNSFVTIDSKVRRLRKYQIEEQRKFSLSLACLIFFFIGAPLGAIIRKGGLGMPVVVSVLFFLLYYIISLTGEKFARESVITPIMGMWISSFILIPLGAFLTYKASTDSVIMNVDTYFNFFKKISRILTKKGPDQHKKEE
jgi:lipopolysaccharide export system permease protein